jgi:hypothetical protein
VELLENRKALAPIGTPLTERRCHVTVPLPVGNDIVPADVQGPLEPVVLYSIIKFDPFSAFMFLKTPNCKV